MTDTSREEKQRMTGTTTDSRRPRGDSVRLHPDAKYSLAGIQERVLATRLRVPVV